MNEDLGFLHDHEEIAWQHFLAQHIGKKNTEDFVRSFYGPITILDSVLNELYVERWLETAEGDALTGIGSIVGIDRYSPVPIYLAFFGFVSQPSGRAFGEARMRKHDEAYTEANYLPDVEYRTAVNLKIALNNGHGTAEEIMYAFDTALQSKGTWVYDLGNATAQLFINKWLDSSDPEFYIINELIPKAAGVKFYITISGPLVFGFVDVGNYYGFGVGVLSTIHL